MLTKEVKTERYCKISFNSTDHIIIMKFIGDMSDKEYKDIWRTSVDYAFELGIEKIIIDQSQIGTVPFMARAWVITGMYGKIKRELSPDLVISVISSANSGHRSGMQYLVKGFQKISGYLIEFHNTHKDATKWLNSLRD